MLISPAACFTFLSLSSSFSLFLGLLPRDVSSCLLVTLGGQRISSQAVALCSGRAAQVPVGVSRTFDKWAFWKKLCIVNAGSEAPLRFHSISDRPAIIDIRAEMPGENVPKTSLLFLLIGFVVGLPYFFEKIWAIWKAEARHRHH